jgi:hypothetical protein
MVDCFPDFCMSILQKYASITSKGDVSDILLSMLRKVRIQVYLGLLLLLIFEEGMHCMSLEVGGEPSREEHWRRSYGIRASVGCLL